MLFVLVHAASVPDRDGALDLLKAIRHRFADSAYAGEKLATALSCLGRWTLDIVRRSDPAGSFVARTFAWLVLRFRQM